MTSAHVQQNYHWQAAKRSLCFQFNTGGSRMCAGGGGNHPTVGGTIPRVQAHLGDSGPRAAPDQSLPGVSKLMVPISLPPSAGKDPQVRLRKVQTRRRACIWGKGHTGQPPSSATFAPATRPFHLQEMHLAKRTHARMKCYAPTVTEALHFCFCLHFRGLLFCLSVSRLNRF